MERTVTDIRFPHLPLFGAAALMLIAIGSIAVARLVARPEPSPIAALSVLETRLLTFEDSDEGRILIRTAADHTVIAIAEPGTNGFLRGTLRGLMRTRKQDGADLLAPFRLSKLSNGALILVDETNQVTLDLDAYGRTNADVFRAFLPSSPTQGGS